MFEVEVLIICHVEKSRLKLFMIYLIIVLCEILTFNWNPFKLYFYKFWNIEIV